MEAFMRTDAVMVVALKGWNTQGLRTSNPTLIHRGIAQLEVQTAQGVQLSHFDGSPGRWKQWHQLWFDDNARRMGIHFGHLPQGKLRFGMETSIGPASLKSRGQLQHLSGKWAVEAKEIKPFPFNTLARTPLLAVHSVRIISATRGGRCVIGEVVFDSTRPTTGAQTLFGFVQTADVAPSATAWRPPTMWNATPETQTRCVREFTAYKIVKRFLPPPTQKQIVRLSGRANADNRWPLAFQIEPFDFAKVKLGQSLKFKSWPAPVPKS